MNKKKYNEMLNKTLQPEIDRLKRREEIAKKIIGSMNTRVNIDYCGLEEWRLLDIIGREIDFLVK